MTAYRYYIWKNAKLIDDCQRLSTVQSKLAKLAQRSNPEDDEIWVTDTETDENFDISYFIPTFVRQ